MSGTLDQARRRSSTSAPSMSGNPRSRITRSGGLSVAQRSASAPVSAACTEKPSSSSPARRKRRICTSSSTTRTTGLASFIGTDLGLARRRCKGQKDRHRGALIGARARSLDLAAVGGDEGLRDPQAKTRARGRGRVAGAAGKSLAELRGLLRGEPDAFVMDRKHDVAAVAFGRYGDRRARGGILGRVVDDLSEGLLDQHGVHINERQVRIHVEREAVAGEPPTPALERGIDDVLRLDPFLSRPDLFAADPSRVEEILDIVVE